MAEGAKKKKGKKGLIIGLVLLVVFIAAGAVAGLAMAGKINIPGLTPKKKAPPTAAGAAKPADKPKATEPPKPEEDPADNAPAKDPAPTTKVVDKAGAEKLAGVWNEMPAAKLADVVADWKPDDLAMVMNEMDDDKSALLLAALKPGIASKVSSALKTLASQVPVDQE